MDEHLRIYNEIDIALDTFPYSGVTTSIEAFSMGVPVLNLKGNHFVSHAGESLLNNIGLEDWVANSEEDYIAKAIAFSANLSEIASLRESLRERLFTSPICDAPRFASNLEIAFRSMWHKWCDQIL